MDLGIINLRTHTPAKNGTPITAKIELLSPQTVELRFNTINGTPWLQIYFLLVRIKIKHMEMAIIRRETAGTGSNQYNESETIIKYEVMDGAPAKGKQDVHVQLLSTLSTPVCSLVARSSCVPRQQLRDNCHDDGSTVYICTKVVLFIFSISSENREALPCRLSSESWTLRAENRRNGLDTSVTTIVAVIK